MQGMGNSGERQTLVATGRLPANCRALFSVSESIASHRDLSELFHDLAQRLGDVIQFDYLSVRLHDSERNIMRRYVLERSSPVESFDNHELASTKTIHVDVRLLQLQLAVEKFQNAQIASGGIWHRKSNSH